MIFDSAAALPTAAVTISEHASFTISFISPSFLFRSRTCTPQKFFELPFPAAARLAGYDQIETWHKSDQLAARAWFGASVGRNSCAAATALAGMPCGQFPAVRKDLRI